MSNKLDSHQENIAAIMNAMADSIKNASDEDIVAEAKVEQADINIKAASIRNLLKKAVVDHQQSNEVVNAPVTSETKSPKTTLEAHFSQKIEISEDKELAKVDLSIVYQRSNSNGKKFRAILQMWRSLVNLFTQKRYNFWPQMASAALFLLFCLFSGLLVLMINNNLHHHNARISQVWPPQNKEPINRPSPSPNHTGNNGEQTSLPSNNGTKVNAKIDGNPNPIANPKINSSANGTNSNHEKKPGILRSGSTKLNIAALKEVKTIFIDPQEEEFTNNIYQQLMATGKAQTTLNFLDDRDNVNARLRIKVDNSLVKVDLISGSEVIWSKSEHFTKPSLNEAERLAKIIITELAKDIEKAAN